MTSKSERQRTSGPQKRSKSDFMYCRKFTLRPARNLVKEFCARWFFTLASLCCIHKRLNRYVIIPIYFYMVVALSDCCSFCAMIKWTRKYFFWQTDAARNCEAGRCPLFLDFCVLYSPNFFRTPFHLFLVTLERGCEKKLHILWCMA